MSPRVALGLHAVSADEQRSDFTPTLWDPDPRVLQVVFAGAHADVGGGYPTTNNESGLSDCALQWMLRELTSVGLQFSGPPAPPFRPDPAGVAHAPWKQLPWSTLPVHARSFPMGLALSQCVLDRLSLPAVVDDPASAPAPYWPKSLRNYLATPGVRQGITVVAR